MVQEILPRKAGLRRAIERIGLLKSETDERIIALIAGGSGSGKTKAIAQQLMNAFPGEALIHSMDHFYHGAEFMRREAARGNPLNYDQLEAVDMNSFRQSLISYRMGRPVRKRRYDHASGLALITEETLPMRRILIGEGLFTLHESIRKLGNVRIFVDISTHGQLIRRLLRDTIERQSMSPRDMLRYFAETVVPMHEAYGESTKEGADIVIRNEYNPKNESGRAIARERQIKYPLNGNQGHEIPFLDAELLGRVIQIDRYFNPPDRILAHTGESLRIREEAGTISFCYKGPDSDEPGIRERPKLEFEIDAETEKSFLEIYGSRIRTIRKNRSLYRKGSLVFSVDDVTSTDTYGQIRKLDRFLEFRLSGRDEERERYEIQDILRELEVDPDTAMTDAYVEM